MLLCLYQLFMKYLRSKQQLKEMLESGKIILLIFVDPNEFMPAKLLLNYVYSHGATPKIDHLLFIWNQVDQELYDRFNVVAFPQITVLRGNLTIYSSLGYNREQANQAIELLIQQSGMGKLTKQLKKNLTHCPNKHQLNLLNSNKGQIYVGGCFECNLCKRLCHFQESRPTLHCELCSYDICPVCSYQDVLL